MADGSVPDDKASDAKTRDFEMERRLEALADLTPSELRREWRRLYRSPPPRLSRDLLIRAVAYRVQELRYGGLTKATRRKLASLQGAGDLGEQLAKARIRRIKAGTRLLREWNGRTHTVMVEKDGFTYRGQNYRSLSAVARAITGARWSGPRFFGVAKSKSNSDA